MKTTQTQTTDRNPQPAIEPTLVGLQRLDLLKKVSLRLRDPAIYKVGLVLYDLIHKWLPLRFKAHYDYFPVIEDGRSEVCQEYLPRKADTACVGCPIFAVTLNRKCIHGRQPDELKAQLKVVKGSEVQFLSVLSEDNLEGVTRLIAQHIEITRGLLSILRRTKTQLSERDLGWLSDLENDLQWVEQQYKDGLEGEI